MFVARAFIPVIVSFVWASLPAAADETPPTITVLTVRAEREAYSVGDPIPLRVEVVAAAAADGTVRVPDGDSPGPPLDMELIITHRPTGTALPAGRALTGNRSEGWKSVRRQPGQRTSAAYSLRELVRLPFPEEGEYVIEAEWQGVAAKPFAFTIRPPEHASFERTIDVPLGEPEDGVKTVHHRFWVSRERRDAGSYRLMYQRADTLAHEATLLAEQDDPLAPEIAVRGRPRGWHARIFIAWTTAGEGRYTELRSDGKLEYEPVAFELLHDGPVGLRARVDPDSEEIELWVRRKGDRGLSPLVAIHILPDGTQVD
jgi:hypothetical protein